MPFEGDFLEANITVDVILCSGITVDKENVFI